MMQKKSGTISFGVLSVYAGPGQSSQSQRCLGSLYWAWAVWAGKQICELLVQICCLAFLKICLKIQFCISNIQICFPAQPAQAQYGLPRQRWL